MKNVFLLFFSVLIAHTSFGQKKPISIKDFDKWKRLEGISTSNNGEYVMYKIAREEGNKTLVIHNLKNEAVDSFYRVSKSGFTFGAKNALVTVVTDHEALRQLKLKKEKKENYPKDSLFLVDLSDLSTTYIDRIKSWKTPETNGRWLAYLQEKPLPEPEEDSTKTDSLEIEVEEKDLPEEDKKKEKKVDKNARTLVVMDLTTKATKEYVNVMDYGFSNNGSICYFNSLGDSTFEQGLYYLNTKTGQIQKSKIEAHSFSNLCVDTSGLHLAFTFTEQGKKAKERIYQIGLVNIEKNQTHYTIDSTSLKLKLRIGSGSLRFTENGKRLLFGVNKKTKTYEKDSTKLKEELAALDIWSHMDGRLQPQQLKEVKADAKRSINYFLDIKSKKTVQVGHGDFSSVSFSQKSEGRYAIVSESSPYFKERSWDYPWARDVYLVDVEKGTETKLFERFMGSVGISPAGKYVYWFNQESGLWWLMDLKSKKKTCLSRENKNKYVNIDDDHPALPGSFGIGGWYEDDAFLFLNSKYGFTAIDPTFKRSPQEFSGKQSKTRERIKRISSDRFIAAEYGFLVEQFNTITKQKESYWLNYNFKEKDFEIREEQNKDGAYYNYYTTSKNRATSLYRLESNQVYPELYIKNKNSFKKLSTTNAQQAKYKWYKTKLVSYLSADGDSLQGILYMPESYDESKKYPMIVYFYERMSDNINSYQTPRASYSTVSRSFYCSNDYFVFVPDIAYYDGEPGQSAFNCIIPGVLSVLQDHPFIDPNRMALQGQSWGGYQTAHLITRSDLFACAMAGAPVSNMTSAYGGIRWGSGYNRAFQYEHGQSRIGGSLWDKPLHYIENSPLFYADRVNTPLLIMHNDNDGAVPWYQGIEYFTALRRLDKEVWMLVYNNEEHNLRKRPNRVDLSNRMFGFFNYYLKDAEEPVWMEKGIPATDKGKYNGY